MLLGLALLSLRSSALRAHDFWIEPSSFEPMPGAAVGFHLAVGQQWAGDPLPRSNQRIVRFVLAGPLGDTEGVAIAGVEGVDPAGLARVAGPGLYLAGYESNNAPLELEPQKFEDYLRLEGLDSIVAERARRGEAQSNSHEVYARCAKSLLRVAGEPTGKPDRGFSRVLGFTLELVPEQDPYASGAGVELPVRVLYQGKPLANVLVIAMRKAAPLQPVQERSDRQGRVRLRLADPGTWLVKAVHMVRLDAERAKGEAADWQSYWASLTFALPAR